MKNRIFCLLLSLGQATATGQTLFVPNGFSASGVGTSNTGGVGVGTADPQATFEVLGFGQVLRNSASTSYTTLRLYNSQNHGLRSLEFDYSGPSYPGGLVYSGPTGESGSITTTGAYPLTLGTNNTMRMTIKGDGNVGINNINPGALLDVRSPGATQFHLSTYRTFSASRNWGVATNLLTEGDFAILESTTNSDAPSVARFLIDGSGRVGINNTAPAALLDIKTSSSPQLYLSTTRTFSTSRNWGIGTNWNAEGDFAILASTNYSTNPSVTRLLIDVNGNVGVGTSSPGSYKLAVEGKIGAREVNVTIAAWSDYVFSKDYKLRPLSELQQFIDEHHHLPDVPSEKEVLQNGQNLGEMNAVLLRKVEELTLYVIEQQSEISALRSEVNEIKNKN